MKKFSLILALIILLNTGTTVLALSFPSKYEVLQGNTLEIKIPREKATFISGNFSGESILFLKEENQFRGYLGINRTLAPSIKNLDISLFTPGKGSEKFVIPVTIQKKEFKIQSFTLPQKTQKLFEKDYQTPTWNAIYKSMENPATTQLWQDKFILPVVGRITLGFGDRLFINKKASGTHFGIDYANKTGTPIYAPNSGTVKLASYTPAYGNVIVIDHGLNIFSMYLHLDSYNVKAGDKVSQGQLIAKVGSTGLADGPHLHFTMFVNKTIVDPEQWIFNYNF